MIAAHESEYKDVIFRGVDCIGERSNFSGSSAGGGNYLRAEFRASVSGGQPKPVEISAASVGGGAGIWNEPATGGGGGAEGICVHGAEHHVRAGNGAGDWESNAGETNTV